MVRREQRAAEAKRGSILQQSPRQALREGTFLGPKKQLQSWWTKAGAKEPPRAGMPRNKASAGVPGPARKPSGSVTPCRLMPSTAVLGRGQSRDTGVGAGQTTGQVRRPPSSERETKAVGGFLSPQGTGRKACQIRSLSRRRGQKQKPKGVQRAQRPGLLAPGPCMAISRPFTVLGGHRWPQDRREAHTLRAPESKTKERSDVFSLLT